MWRIVLNVVLTVTFVTALVGIVRFMADGGMAEIDRSLASVSFSTRGEEAFNITARLHLLRQRMDLGETPADDYELEARIQSLVSGMRLYAYGVEVPEAGGLSRLYAAIGRLMGRPDSFADGNTQQDRLVEEAFFWERNRVYDRAIVLYDEAMGAAGAVGAASEVIRLHAAFCLLMTADYDAAEKQCRELSESSRDPTVLNSVQLILDFIDDVRSRSALLEASGGRGLEHGKGLYFGVDYAGAIEELDDFLSGADSRTEQSEARYYKGRSHEELGQIAEAVDEYRRVILLGEDGQWYREAGNRLLMLEAFYDVGYDPEDDLAAMGKESADAGISEMIESLSSLREEEEGKDSFIDVPPIRHTAEAEDGRTGEILVKTFPAGARITVGGRDFGPSPVFVPDLPLGETLVEAEFDGEVRGTEIIVAPAGIAAVSFDFMPSTGTLVVGSYWMDTVFYIDGKRVYPVDGVLRGQEPGRRRLKVIGKSLSGNEVSWEGTVTVIAGDVVSLAVP